MTEAILIDIDPPQPATCCIGCGAPRTGPFCAQCGQVAPRGRLTLRRVGAHLVADAFDVNRGLLFTARELSRRPGGAMREYVAGRTARFTNPVKYFLIAAALSTLVYLATGTAAEMQDQMVTGATHTAPDAERLARVLGAASSTMLAYLNLVMVGSVSFATLATRALFRRAGMNLAEHAVFNLYAHAHSSLFFVAILLAGRALGLSNDVTMGSYLAFSIGYYAWAAQAFFRMRPVGAAIRAAAAMLLTLVVYGTIVLVGIGMYASWLLRQG